MVSRKTLRTLFAGLSLLALCFCHKQGNTGGGVVATLSGKPISEGDLQESARFVGLSDLATQALDKWPSAAQKILFQETVYDRLLLDKAKEEGVTATAKEIAFEKNRLVNASSPSGSSQHFDPPDSLIRRKILLKKAASILAPPPALRRKDLLSYYMIHKDRFTVPEKAVVRDIVVRSEDEGNSILAAVKAGSSFSALAKAKSLSPESRNGGLLPPFALGEMPSPFYRVFSMKPGEVSPLIPSPYGYHLLKLVKIIAPSVRPFAAVRRRIRSKLNRLSQDLAMKTWFHQELQSKQLIISPRYRLVLSLSSD